jgi:hypothetical protein
VFIRLITVLAVLATVGLLAACGDGGGNKSNGGGAGKASERLSVAEYKAKLAELDKRETKVHAEAEKALKATDVDEIKSRLEAFAADQEKLGDDLDALKPPANAEAANAQVARGARLLATEVQAIVDTLSPNMTPKLALLVVENGLGRAKGSAELDAGLKALSKLGYKGE